MLKSKIDESGYKQIYIAKQLGISNQCLSGKIKNKTEFTGSQIQALCILLNIDVQQKEQIFFALWVDFKSTNCFETTNEGGETIERNWDDQENIKTLRVG